MLEGILNALVSAVNDPPPVCEHGHSSRSAGLRYKRVMTVLGPVQLHRRYFYEAGCRRGKSPFDDLLDIEGTMYSPGVRNMMAYMGATAAYREGAESLCRLADLDIPAKSIERLCATIGPQVETYRRSCAEASDLRNLGKGQQQQTLYIEYDGTGIPVLKRETAGRAGKGPNGESKTREIKVGCVFTQTCLDPDGYPVRDEASTSYIGACESAERFQWRILQEAKVRGLDQVSRICVIGDGAPWIWTIAEEHFPHAWQIVDIYHAKEHYCAVAKMVYPENSEPLKEWMDLRKHELEDGDVPAVVRALSLLRTRNKSAQTARDKAIAYFQKNAERMRYAEFRAQGLFVGSGVIEAGCKTVIGKRLKQSGMHWTVDSANCITNIRCLFLSGCWDDFWESRAAA
jgi:hypothetical protein